MGSDGLRSARFLTDKTICLIAGTGSTRLPYCFSFNCLISASPVITGGRSSPPLHRDRVRQNN